jgi:alpha-tubulin suppressor-like RCC1 family protein
VGHGDEKGKHPRPTPINAMAGVRMRSVAAGIYHNLALRWDGRVYSWGNNDRGQQGPEDKLTKPTPALVEGLESVRSIAASHLHSFAVTQSGAVFNGAVLCCLTPNRKMRLGRASSRGSGR